MSRAPGLHPGDSTHPPGTRSQMEREREGERLAHLDGALATLQGPVASPLPPLPLWCGVSLCTWQRKLKGE